MIRMRAGTSQNFAGQPVSRLRADTREDVLVTRFWAVLVVAVLAGAIAADVAFNQATPNICYTQTMGFACDNAQLYGNGYLNLTLTQQTDAPINITAISCDSAAVAQNAVKFTTPLHMQIYGSATITGNFVAPLRCFDGVEPFSGSIGSTFYGYIIVNYTDLYLLKNHSATFSIVETVESPAPTPTIITTSTSTSTTTTSSSTAPPYYAQSDWTK